MATKTAYQYDYAGLLVGTTEADESPLEEGVFLLPAYCTFATPPAEIPEGLWPLWRAEQWELIERPAGPDEDTSPLAKLQTFLLANPDVAALLERGDSPAASPAA
jgi:hypothetical protein